MFPLCSNAATFSDTFGPFKMDQLLKARKLSSASARRKRIQQHQEEEILAQKRYMEHRRRILYDELIEVDDEHSQSESDEEMASTSRHERDDSVQTPSERSVATPHDTPSTQAMIDSSDTIHLDTSSMKNRPELQLLVPETPLGVDEPATIVSSSPGPKMLASLATPSDWQYDRFSMFLADSLEIAESPQDISLVPELEDDEEDSPLETARPVSYKLPKVRPSVISISSRSSSKKRRTASMQTPLSQEPRSNSPPPPPPPPRSEKRLSMMSVRSGFQACEAKPVEVPDLPNNALYMISNASKESFGHFQPTVGVQRKASAPLLSAIKTSHARMSSIKNLMKSPAHARVPSIISSSRPESRSSTGRPSTSAADILNDNYNPFETVPANLHEQPRRSSFKPRPKSSHRPSTSSMYSVTALPIPPANDNLPEPLPQSQIRSIHRKKSFSSLRKRSESIGQAIKFAAMKSKSTPRYEESPPPPPVPVLMTPALPPKVSVDFGSFPTPPLPSPRSRKSVASFSFFPPSPRVGGPVGLGLKV